MSGSWSDPKSKFIQPEDEILTPDEAAPHDVTPSGVAEETVWREATAEDLSPSGSGLTKTEERWPHEWHSLCWMLASGASQKQCADELGGGYTQAWISVVANKPDVVRKIEQIRQQHWGEKLEQRFANIAPKAIDLMTQIVEGRGAGQSAKLSERWDASKWLLEKVTGKPEARNEKGQGETVLQILEALDKLKGAAAPEQAEQVREVRELAEGLTKETDWMDDFVNNIAQPKGEEGNTK